MNLMGLAAAVCHSFEESSNRVSSQIVMVKDGHSRDVVTRLDTDLDAAVKTYVQQLPGNTVVLSEEGSAPDRYAIWENKDLLVVDPLDGSNNVALGLPGYCFMAAHIVDLRLTSSLVVLPENDLYLIWQDGNLLTSQEVLFGLSAPSSSIYYAYPPRLRDEDEIARDKIWRVIDKYSSGAHRSGSAGIGLFHLLRGAHRAFVGHKVRVWDVLAYFPILHDVGFQVRYCLERTTATIIVSRDSNFLDEVGEIFGKHSGHEFSEYDSRAPIVIDGQ